MFEPTQNTLDVSRVPEKIFEYINEQQEDALAYVLSENDSSLQSIDSSRFYYSTIGRILAGTNNSISLIEESFETDDDSDVLVGDLSFRYETSLKGGDGNQLGKDARLFKRALDLMFVNIPEDVLIEDSQTVNISAEKSTPDSRVLLLGEGTGIYEQRIWTDVVYRFRGSAYL